MHSQGKGISGSALPFRRKPPKWTTITPAAVVELIIKLAKKGNILLLPDSHHQPSIFQQVCHQVRSVSSLETNTPFHKSDS